MFGGVISTEYAPDGSILGIRLAEQNVILTHAGALTPFYGEDTLRRKNKASVTFHRNGMIKSVALEKQQEVMTPIGELPAELITFYDTGEVHRVFPLDGKLSGYWSEEDERALNIPLTFDFGFASFTALLSGICFYKSGGVRSITLFPKETVSVLTQYGLISTRQGLALYEDGTLASLEPAVPAKIKTPIGGLTAYNANAHGITAASNSLSFDHNGRVSRLMTSSDKIIIQDKEKRSRKTYAPREITPAEDDGVITIPLEITFDYAANAICLIDSDGSESKCSCEASFTILHEQYNCAACAAGSCGGCQRGAVRP
jgi:hypothetical protein